MPGERQARGARGLTPEALRRDLEELSRNLWWSWRPEGCALWRRVAAELPLSRIGLLSNPVLLVRALRRSHLRALASDAECAGLHARVFALLRRALRGSAAPAGLAPGAPVAYFSMEFGLHESLPIYAGGLGILAGDHVKSAGDESVPLVGVGLFYHQGYFRQEIDARGRHGVARSRARPEDLPLEAVRDRSGREVRVPVELPGRTVLARVWRLRAGRVQVLLLDTDVAGNARADRRITDRLYGGTREDRIRQEVVAGVGGVRALRALGLSPGVWHLNEGHVAFLTLERLREARERPGLSVAEALETIAADTVFTTHTPVPEGNEVFDLALAERYLAPHAARAGIPVEEYLALGLDHGAGGRPFLSMTVLALRLSRFRNGVSRLHGEVSRRMWRHLWPGFRAEDVPIASVTNGVHVPSWVAPGMDRLLRTSLGEDWSGRLDDPAFWKRASSLPDDSLWELRKELKWRLVHFARLRESERLRRLGWSGARRRAALDGLLDAGAFTIGFARRFALYKRTALIFHDLDRARRLFASHKRPVQIIFAGKPHPEDLQGAAVFDRISAISRMPGFRGKVLLLEDYDMEVARHLVQGADLWLNNPRRPLEASGTSGEKVPINGGLNLSVLDGWWCEGSAPDTGWAIGKPIDYADSRLQDAEDARSLHRALAEEILPLYYRRDRRGVPAAWLRKVKSAMASLVPRFNTSHMVLEYARRMYRPALENGIRLRAGGGKRVRELVRWKEDVLRSWPLVHLRGASRARGGALEVEVFLGAIPPGSLAVRDQEGRDHAVRASAALGPGHYRLRIPGALAGGRRRKGRTLRLYPRHPLLVAPVELGLAIEIVV
jgi:starch phosphorylase